MKKYLVTGGTGFIGSAVVRMLLKDGHRVVVIDNNTRGRTSRLADIAKDVEMIEADVRNAEKVKSAARGVDGIIHLAFINGTRYFYEKPEEVLDVGVKGMVAVVDAARAHDIGELILASSSEVYQTPPEIPTGESVPLLIPDPLNPRYSYAGGKLISELMALNYGRKYFNRVIVFRPHNIYGPDMGFEHVIPEFIMRAKTLIENTPVGPIDFKIQGNGSETRAFCFIDDFVEGLRCLLKNGRHLNIYHIGNDTETSINDLVSLVLSMFSREFNIVKTDRTQGSVLRRCPDIGKLKALGYSPGINLRQGVQKTYDWYNKLESRG